MLKTAGHIVIALCLLPIRWALANPLDDGVAAYGRGDYAAALRLLHPLAKRDEHPLAKPDEALAQRILGHMYAEGHGVTQDTLEAYRWYRLAAEQGDVTAAFNVGQAFFYGKGVTQDCREAARWFRLAAKRGDPAQYALGDSYYFGQGNNYAEAAHWYRRAAANNPEPLDWVDPYAALGTLYFFGCFGEGGLGVLKDYSQAMTWYRMAAEKGHAGAQWIMGFMYAEGKGVPSDLGEAIKWRGRSANQGNVTGQTDLGFMYALGKGVPRDYVQAHKWLNLSDTAGARRGRDFVVAKMTPAQFAEAKRLASEWKPRPERSEE